MSMVTHATDCLLVIFGATGDLTRRKLIPALYRLERNNQLPQAFSVVAVARRPYSTKEYVEEISETVKGHLQDSFDGHIWKDFTERIHYQPLEFDHEEDYDILKHKLDHLDEELNTRGNRLYYMAVSPQHFGSIVRQVEARGLLNRSRGWQRVMIEKPFGHDAPSARELNRTLRQYFEEEEIFRIDHYLVKEMVQNLMTIRAANQIFEPTLNAEHIDHVQIISTEAEGVGTRGSYYDKAGALRDMVQNHMLQMLALTAMDMPNLLTPEKLRAEKVRILKSLVALKPENMERQLVLGQYMGYRKEEQVLEDSSTETFVAVKVYLNHLRWKGVPFYLKTGKGLSDKAARIVIQYRLPLGSWSLVETTQTLTPNRLTINIQPQEGVVLSFNTKEPGTLDTLMPVNMDFCQNCLAGTNTPEAYEKLLDDAMRGDLASFTHWDEVEASWQWIDGIIQWARDHPESVKPYVQGSRGPEGAEAMIRGDEGREWV